MNNEFAMHYAIICWCPYKRLSSAQAYLILGPGPINEHPNCRSCHNFWQRLIFLLLCVLTSVPLWVATTLATTSSPSRPVGSQLRTNWCRRSRRGVREGGNKRWRPPFTGVTRWPVGRALHSPPSRHLTRCSNQIMAEVAVTSTAASITDTITTEQAKVSMGARHGKSSNYFPLGVSTIKHKQNHPNLTIFPNENKLPFNHQKLNNSFNFSIPMS